MQELAIIGIFVAAIVYLIREVVKSFRRKSACNTGCGKCSAINFDQIEEKVKSQGLTPRL